MIVGSTILLLHRNWRPLEHRAAIQLIVRSIAGVPIGILLLTNTPAGMIQRGLGFLSIAYATYNLVGPRSLRHAILPGPMVWAS